MAIGMLRAGMTHICVSKEVGANIPAVRSWWNNHMKGISLENTPGRERKNSLPKIAKILYPSLPAKKQ